MLKMFSILLLTLAVISVGVQAQNKTVMTKKPIIMNEPASTNITHVRTDHHNVNLNPAAGINWVSVDTMANDYGPAISILNPVAYDYGSNVVALVHRGGSYAAGSGELWYNISTDGGATWTRVGSINTGNSAARYPSMAISNPTGGSIDGTIGLFAWPQLTPSAFGNLGYGADSPLGGNSSFWVELLPPPNYSSQVPCWTGGDWMFWSSDNQDDASYTIFRTTDFSTIATTELPSSDFEDGGNICVGGVYNSGNGMNYLGFFGTFADPDTNNRINGGWYPGYYTSSDDGATWNGPNVIDFRTIPALDGYDQLFDYINQDGFVSYAGDINVDMDGYVHMTFTVTDTGATSDEGDNALVEVFQSASGWDAKVISTNIPTLFWTMNFDDPGLGQMGPSGYLAFNEDRNVEACVWNAPANPTDTIADVFISYRTLSGDWSTPENITNTPLMNEDGCHLAPQIMAGSGANEWVAFPGYFYETGYDSAAVDVVAPTTFYVGTYSFTAMVDAVDDPGVSVNSFALKQNYPNPFNPSTTINYSIGEKTNVLIKVYDMLGREVTTLVNDVEQAGNHEVKFDASNLVSGVYVYKIQAGEYTSSKKMMLLK